MKDYFLINNRSGKKTKKIWLKKNKPELYKIITDYNEKHSIPDKTPFKEKVFLFIFCHI